MSPNKVAFAGDMEMEANKTSKDIANHIVVTMERLLKEGADKNWVAQGLAGVGTPESMALRERLLDDEADEDFVVQGLAGVGTSESMALRGILLGCGIDTDLVAQGLAGVSTPESMELRERLLHSGASKDVVAFGLAGVGTPESMALRERLLNDGASKNCIAFGLAGVGTPESIALRKRLLKEKDPEFDISSANSIFSHTAQGLAGVGTYKAMKLHERFLREGADVDCIAFGLAGVSTPESMELRGRLLRKGADKNYIAIGLTGVGTPRAMELRENLLREGADKEYIAWSLAGVNSDESNAFREKYFSSDPTLYAKSFATGWPELNGVVCRYGFEKMSVGDEKMVHSRTVKNVAESILFMSPTQKAMEAAECKFELEKEVKKFHSGKKLTEKLGKSAARAAKRYGVSVRSVERASRVLKQGDTMLIEAVRTNKVTLYAAADVAGLPKKIQRRIIKAGVVTEIAVIVRKSGGAAALIASVDKGKLVQNRTRKSSKSKPEISPEPILARTIPAGYANPNPADQSCTNPNNQNKEQSNSTNSCSSPNNNFDNYLQDQLKPTEACSNINDRAWVPQALKSITQQFTSELNRIISLWELPYM